MSLTERDFLVLLLGASRGSLESETRLQKLAFLGIREMGLEKFTNFSWDKYGPLSQGIWKTSRRMQRQGLLRILEDDKVTFMGDTYTIRTFELTDKGNKELSKTVKSYEREYALIRRLFSKYGNLSLDRLLNYVHTAYSVNDL
jgi:uncharacterized protein YwgA